MSKGSIFKQAMEGVKQLKHRGKVRSHKTVPHEKRSMTVETSVMKDDFLFDIDITTTPGQILFFSTPSLPYRVIKRLKKGEYPIQSRIDLHGKQIGEASYLLHNFLENSFEHGKQHLLVVHGKGSCKIKSAVDKWLKESPLVLAFTSARSDDGGAGALYLLIKKCKSA